WGRCTVVMKILLLSTTFRPIGYGLRLISVISKNNLTSGNPPKPAERERSESRCLLDRELLVTLAPQNDKCVVVTVRGPRTGRYFAKLDELPVTRIFDAKTQVIANRRRHI